MADSASTRQVAGETLVELGAEIPNLVVLFEINTLTASSISGQRNRT